MFFPPTGTKYPIKNSIEKKREEKKTIAKPFALDANAKNITVRNLFGFKIFF